jgi:hypothetical protein
MFEPQLVFAFAVTLYRVVPKLPRSIGRSQRSKSECFARSCAARVDSLDTVLIPRIGILGAAINKLIFSYLVPTMCLSSPKHFWRRSKRAKAVSTEEETKKIVLAR